jgi:hypothetical protein
MATGVTTQSPFFENPYLTVTEYKNAPTAIDFDNLVVGGNAGAQDAELANVILRASSFMDEYLNQNLNAATQTENQRIRLSNSGYLAIHPNNNPVISLQSMSYGTDPNGLTTLSDPSKAWFEGQQIIVPLSQLATTYSSQGALSFGVGAAPRQQMFVTYNYTSGYVNSLIATATATQSTLTVQTANGIVAGMQLRIYDGASSERVTVASTYTYGSTTVPLTAPLAYTHANTISIGNLPQAIKEACVLVTTAFLKVRGDNSLTMNVTTQPNGNVAGATKFGNEMAIALEMLSLYRRIR